MTSKELVDLISSLRYLPKVDKEILIDGAMVGYGHAEALLPTLSIFSKLSTIESLGGITFSKIADEPLFYAGFNLKSNLGLFSIKIKK